MRRSSIRDRHADIVNRRARIGLLIVLTLTGLVVAVSEGRGDRRAETLAAPSPTRAAATPGDGGVDVTAADLLAASEPLRYRNEARGGDELPGVSPPARLETFDVTAGATAKLPGTSLAPPPPTTTLPPPPTTTVPPPPTTTLPPPVAPPPTTTLPPPPPPPPPPTTTLPPPTTTLPPPTTTLPPPPTTTTTVPPQDGWYVTLSADVQCSDAGAVIWWYATNPKEDWSTGWKLIIDSDSRGVFDPGTSITRGSTAGVDESVDSGLHRLLVDVHWEHGGRPDTGHGTFTITAEVACDI